MFLGVVVLLVALSLSAVAAYYSIVGLVAIFAAAALPIVVMGSILEVAKITVTVWLHQHWKECQFLMKTYLTVAVVVLMFITSMGIFGFLSKAHIEQTTTVGSNAVVIEDIDRQIEVQSKIINDSNTVIAQLDQAVQALIDAQRIRGASGSLAVRESQKSERESLNRAITEANRQISELTAQKLPLVQSQKQLEAEVGPLKYIAALIYGDTLTNDLLENAVRWVIIMIVGVFDPLAIVMVLAATESFKWAALARPKPTPTPPAEPKKPPVEEPLGEPFQEILNKNRWNLYEVTETVAAAPAEAVVAAPEAPAAVDPIEKPSYNTNYAAVEVTFGEVELPKTQPSPANEVLLRSRLVENVVANDREESSAVQRPAAPSKNSSKVAFGVKYPSNPVKDDLFLRVDFLPTRLYKFTGAKWIEVDKENTSQYHYNDSYLEMLISKLSKGEYEAGWLSDTEREQIEAILQKNSKGI